MTVVTRTFKVSPEPAKIIDYLKDFGHAEDWDPGTESCTREGSGPIGIGTTWHNVSTIAGVSTELTYTLEKLTSDTIVLVGTNDTATSIDTITVTPGDRGGTEITYQADVQMHGVAKLATPAVRIVFEKLGNDTETQMTEVLNHLQ